MRIGYDVGPIMRGPQTGIPVEEAVARHGLHGRVVLTGYVADVELAALYPGCAYYFAYRSLYEGFRLPVLEAMALGTPVVTSNVSSLPEVAGDAALMVDPYNPAQIAGALRRLLGDESLRDDLRRRGTERAAKFSWEYCAEEHVCACCEVVGA